MFTNVPVLTDMGKTLMLRALDGEAFTFTKFQVGNGILDDGETPESMIELKSLIIDDIPITSSTPVPQEEVEAGEEEEESEEGETQNYLQLTGSFDNSEVQNQFVWTELGLIAEDEDGEEYLYAYGYEPVYADLIRGGGSKIIAEQYFSCIIAVGTTANITANVIPNLTYANKADFDAHVANENNPHNVTAEQIGAAGGEHTHSADDITDGILSVERGGTGASGLSMLAESLSSFITQNFVMGVFTGNGAIRKNIDLGFKPSKVIIFVTNSGVMNFYNRNYFDEEGGYHEYPYYRNSTGIAYIAPGKNLVYHGGVVGMHDVMSANELFSTPLGAAAVTNNGFAVGFSNRGYSYNVTYRYYWMSILMNEKNVDYFYIAFK